MNVPVSLYIFVLSILPTFEARYSIIYATITHYPLIKSVLIGVMSIVFLSISLPFLIPKIEDIIKYLEKKDIKKISSLYFYYLKKVRKKSKGYINTWGLVGLIFFVAIPLPGTGIWTGSLVAYIFGMEKRKAIVSLLIGGLLSMTITLFLILSVKII